MARGARPTRSVGSTVGEHSPRGVDTNFVTVVFQVVVVVVVLFNCFFTSQQEVTRTVTRGVQY